MRGAVRLSSLLLALALPAAQLVPLDGAAYAKLIASHRGKVVLVDFWATWCEPCREELPKLVALTKKLDPKRFALVTVSADEPEQEATAGAFLTREQAPTPHYIKRTEDDQTFIDAIDKEWSGGLPALFLYDATGKLAATFFGESEIGDIKAAIQKTLAK